MIARGIRARVGLSIILHRGLGRCVTAEPTMQPATERAREREREREKASASEGRIRARTESETASSNRRKLFKIAGGRNVFAGLGFPRLIAPDMPDSFEPSPSPPLSHSRAPV